MQDLLVECSDEKLLENFAIHSTNRVIYNGFEPSGRLSIAHFQNVRAANHLIDQGYHVIFFIADIHAQLTGKFAGDIKKITNASLLMIETWKAAGLNPKVQIKFASEEIKKHPEYWPLVIDISRRFAVGDFLECTKEDITVEDLYVCELIYPAMQCADMIILNVDGCIMGIDQKPNNKMAEIYFSDKTNSFTSRSRAPLMMYMPLIQATAATVVSTLCTATIMVPKMSKSVRGTCIYMDDIDAEINRKLNMSYCPSAQAQNNSCLNYMRLLIFPAKREVSVVQKNRQVKTYTDYISLEKDYVMDFIHADDLKQSLKRYISELCKPIRDYFGSRPELKKLLSRVKALS